MSGLSRASFLRILAGVGVSGLLPAPSARAQANGPYDFQFVRLQYDSGDWDVDERMPANVLTTLIDYTNLRVAPQEKVIRLDDPAMLSAPFCYLTGHKLVEFSAAEAANFKRYVQNGGFVLVDDCNHDIDGLFARSFERQMAALFGPSSLKKLAKSHAIYRSFFKFDGPPGTNMELNGWGDDLVHDYLKGIDVAGRLGVLYSNKDYGCEWDYDWRNKRFLAEDNTKFAVNIILYALTA